jgi:predicted dehydrogenase
MRINQRLVMMAAFTALVCSGQAPLKVGIIGLDTSHAVRFTELLNDSNAVGHVGGAVVVAAFKGGSPTVDKSANRIEGFTRDVTTKYHVRLVPSIEELCRQVDAVLLLSVDGRQHLDQVRAVFAAKKPVFIDKPLAGSLKDAREIARLSSEAGVLFFSASSVRYLPMFIELKNDATLGRIQGALTFGPMEIETYMPDLFWYGIHSVEALYQLMGPGCERVARVHTEGADSVVGTWKDGRIGEIRGLRSSPLAYGAIVFGTKRIAASGNLAHPDQPSGAAYDGLIDEIVKFFQTGKPPVSAAESLEVLSFMEAADRSKLQHGAEVALEPVR